MACVFLNSCALAQLPFNLLRAFTGAAGLGDNQAPRRLHYDGSDFSKPQDPLDPGLLPAVPSQQDPAAVPSQVATR
jgi:hypothetical protein